MAGSCGENLHFRTLEQVISSSSARILDLNWIDASKWNLKAPTGEAGLNIMPHNEGSADGEEGNEDSEGELKATIIK